MVTTFVALYLNDAVLRYAAQRNPATRVNFLLHEPPRTDHVAVLGSSMIANAVSVRQLSDLIGGDAIQLAVGGQGLQEQALIWELYLSRHRSKILLLELHETSLCVGTLPVPLRADRYAPHLDNELISRHLNEYSGKPKAMLWKWIPMYAFAEFSSKIGWQDWVGLAKGLPFDATAPSLYSDQPALLATLRQQQACRHDAATTAIDPAAVKALLSILDSAQDAGMKVILVKPPIFEVEINSREHERQDLIVVSDNAIRPKIDSLSKVYFSFDLQQDPAMFDDIRHASQRGSVQFTMELAAAISKK